ncbi:alpha-ribazole phosphatase [Nitrospira sp.]|nr:alpha-ribazole phosphatase [Nitrospira sp.]
MPTLLLVRHGETDWNRSGQIMGQHPVPLNERGRRQASDLALRLRDQPIGALYSSPVARAIQTAEFLAASRELVIREDPRLREIEVGDWAGRFWRDLDHEPVRRYWYARPNDARFPGGETLAEVQARAAAAMTDALFERDRETVLVVTHGDVLRALVAHLLGLPLTAIHVFRFDHASLTRLESSPGGPGQWTAACINLSEQTSRH